MMRNRPVYFIATSVIAAIILTALPNLLSDYWITVLTEVLIYGLFAASIDIMAGYTGLPSLGHAAFFGTGGYVVGIMVVKFGMGHVPAFLLGMAAVLLLSAILAPLAIRARGIYFLMITVALAQSLWAIAWRWISLTGGDDGLPGISRPDLGLSWWSLSQADGFYYFVLLVSVLAILAMYLITKSPFGQTLVGIRESELRMKSLGYNVWLHTYLAFVISGIFAGLSGIIFAWYNGLVTPAFLSIPLSTEGVRMVVLVGAGTLCGPLLGAAIITVLKAVLSLVTTNWLLILGSVYIIAMIFMPRGIWRVFGKR